MSDLHNKEISLRDLKIILIAIALLSFGVRLYMNFSEELLSGNGGYYPLQVRAIIEHGSLAFPDMPLLFYLDAGVVKLISLFGLTITDDLILNTVKFMDSALFPLLLVPSYHVLKRINRATTRWFLMAILAYLTISVVPLRMFSGFQKNGFALMLLFSSLAYLLCTRVPNRGSIWCTLPYFYCLREQHISAPSCSLRLPFQFFFCIAIVGKHFCIYQRWH
ncbi:hypothetical protein N9355_01575 [Crocinitomicaceae bacterium]|nr:hypothetical protein [Crocinitomicaceae bacterium]